MQTKIGVIGLGYVGTAIEQSFKKHFEVNTYDKFIEKKSTHNNLEELTTNSDIVFLCLPTPMNKDGSCHLNIIENTLAELNQFSFLSKKIFVIKSTIPPGTTDYFCNKFNNLNIIYNPEFLKKLAL